MADDEVDQLPHNHPLFLRDSNMLGTSLISLKLTGPENYTLWSRAMKVALLVKNKLGFVDGSCPKSSYRGELAAQWDRCNVVVLSWLSSTVSSELVSSIMYAASARKVWDEFKERFDKDNLARIYQLWAEIATLRQCTNSITWLGLIVKNQGHMSITWQPCGYKPYANTVNAEGETYVKVHIPGSFMIEEYYKRLVNFLTKSSIGEGSVAATSSSNMAGIVSLLSNVSNSRIYDWIIDADASHHIALYKEVLESLKEIEGENNYGVEIPTGDKSKITHSGDALILGKQKITNVLHVPDFKFNLLSGLYNGKVLGIGKEDSGLYILRREGVVAAKISKEEIADTKLWHQRLGHASSSTLQQLEEQKNKVDHSKSEVIVVLKDFFALVKNQLNIMIKTIRSDNGTEFFNTQCNDLYVSLGIVHQSSCPYTPEQNGVVERKHRHILEVARALRFQNGILVKFWGDCMKTAVYLINKMPSDILKGKSPFELLHKKPPKVDHLRAFCCCAMQEYYLKVTNLLQ
uniref:Integrase catalytic domain-containing protein n=1 Tax=Nicotiana tabacum TaxID=4097 RepID=A0A1S3XK15_TOBAC|nr:PREDICTED: uncharacterized protein LOC107765984 [Nicotiana tabacum]